MSAVNGKIIGKAGRVVNFIAPFWCDYGYNRFPIRITARVFYRKRASHSGMTRPVHALYAEQADLLLDVLRHAGQVLDGLRHFIQ